MAGEIVGFYDGSTSKDGKRITLAGYAAKPEVWREVEAIWARVLANDTNRPKAKSLHMWQANSLDKEFSLANGWDKAKIDSLLEDLSNECLSPYGMREPVEDALEEFCRGSSCAPDEHPVSNMKLRSSADMSS